MVCDRIARGEHHYRVHLDVSSPVDPLTLFTRARGRDGRESLATESLFSARILADGFTGPAISRCAAGGRANNYSRGDWPAVDSHAQRLSGGIVSSERA